MQYHVKRGEEQYGPYSLVEMQEYFRDGRILATDLAKSEALPDWVPVSQILGNIPAAPAVAAPVAIAPQIQSVPLPPNLHWGLLLVILIVGRFLGVLGIAFNWIWSIVLANWARKLNGSNLPMILCAMYPAGFVAGIIAMGAAGASRRLGGGTSTGLIAVGGILILAGAITYLVGIFKIKDAMEDYYNTKENIGLSLSGVMTFFFSLIYFQYHINRIAKWKQTGVLS